LYEVGTIVANAIDFLQISVHWSVGETTYLKIF